MKTRATTVLVLASALSVHAVTYTWDGGGTNNAWSTGDNWDPNGAVPVSASNTTVKLNGMTRLTPAQDIASPFVLNRLEMNQGTSAFTLSGSQLQFVTNSPSPAYIAFDRNATCVINNAIEIPEGTTLMLQIGTWGIELRGLISGAGALEKLEQAGGITLTYATNTFTGGFTVRAQDNNWFKANVTASGAMGTGPVSLYGGTLATNKPDYGGLILNNNTLHTNAFALYKNSPIFANGNVTLSGPIDLNTSALFLRGTGTGTASGPISEGAANAVCKVDTGTWVLSGANTFAGRVTISNGTFRLGAPNTLNSAVPVTVAAGTFDLNGFSQTVSQLRDGPIPGASAIVTSASAATLTVNQTDTTVYGGRLTGALSLVKAGAGSLTLSNSLSATTGSITVSGGTLVAALPASLGNSTNVTVDGGTLDLRVAALADTGTLRLSGSGKAALASGLLESVDRLFLDGVQQTSGTYGAVGSGAQHESAFFDGSGLLLVLANPPITPVDATWDGEGADTLFGTTNNWAGDLLPSFDGTTRAIFATGGSTATVDTAVNLYGLSFTGATAFTVDNGAGSLRIGAGGMFAQVPDSTPRTYSITEDVALGAHQTWNVTNNGAVATALTVAGAIDDGLAAYNLTKIGTGTLILTGNNTYDGATTVKTGGVVRITSATGFGSTNGTTTVENGGIVEMVGGLTVPESFALYGDASTSHQGVLRSNGGSNVLSGLILNGSRIRCNSGSLDIIGGATGGQFVLAAAGGTFIRVSEKPISIGGNTFYAHSDALVILDVTNNVWGQMEVSGNILRTDRDYALPPASMLTFGPSAFGAVNLNGKNQTVGSLVCTYTTPGTRIAYSTIPATLTVNQGGNTTFNGAITGAVTLVKTGTGNLLLSNTNTTYASFIVSNGLLTVSSTGRLGNNSTNILVGAGSLVLSNSVAVADLATVKMPPAGTNTAKIVLGPTVNEKVGWLFYGSKMQRVGTYGSTDSTADHPDNTHFTGPGLLTVLHDNSGTMISVK